MERISASKKKPILLLCIIIVSVSATRIAQQKQPNCNIYSTDGSCQKCSYRYWMTEEKRCIHVSDHCKTWSEHNGHCTSCYHGYSVHNGECMMGDRIVEEKNDVVLTVASDEYELPSYEEGSCECSHHEDLNQNQLYDSKHCNNHQHQVSSQILTLRRIKRSFDGTGNNLKNPHWGSVGQPLRRLCSPNYQDGKSAVWQNVPKPRDISNLVGQISCPITESSLGNNMLFTIWGQFLDHDLSLTPSTEGKKAQVMNIKIPRCDVFFDQQCTGTKQLPFTRSISTRASVRTNINVITAWLDGSQVYGQTKQIADSLRRFKNGKLLVSQGNLLPKNEQGQFVAGDVRANENVALTVIHTILVRQHNRLCDIIVKKYPQLTDEEIYQMARLYVIGLLQHITFDEYLPQLIGKKNLQKIIGRYRYDENTNPNIFTQFSAAAFRIGHPLINSPLKTSDNQGNNIRQVFLRDIFSKPSLVTRESVDRFLNGLIRTSGKERSLELVDDVRNFLSLPPIEVTIDLFSFNLQRGRDHGICSVQGARRRLGLPVKSIKETFEDQHKAKILQLTYHDLDNVDLWLGIVGEKKRPDAVMGDMGIRLAALQYLNIRNGDRLWYENVYPEQIIREIKQTSLADVIIRNSGVISVNRKAFKTI